MQSKAMNRAEGLVARIDDFVTAPLHSRLGITETVCYLSFARV